MPEIRFSRQRESIIENLCSRKDHPTADMVYSEIRTIYPHVSLGTVYRNLALLTEQGEIIRIRTQNGPDRYDGNCAEHYHFLCRCCGEIFDLFPKQPDELIKLIDSWQAGCVETISLNAAGICPACCGKKG